MVQACEVLLSRCKSAYTSAVAWLRERDRGFSALRRAGRAALVMPAMFALGDVVIGNPAVATFAAFGSFAMLLLAGDLCIRRDHVFANWPVHHVRYLLARVIAYWQQVDAELG